LHLKHRLSFSTGPRLKSFQDSSLHTPYIMSFDESDADDEWEVVDILTTSKSVKPDKKPKPAKQEDVDRLAKDLQSQLSLKSTHDTQQILLLEQKMRQQQRLSEQQLGTIQHRLQQMTQLQSQQEQQQKGLDAQRKQLEQQQKQQLLEQQIQIASLSEHQMLTQKQLAEAHQQIQQTAQVAQHVTQNVQSLHQRQQQQATQQQMTEQQIQQQLQEQAQQLHSQSNTQQHLTHLAQQQIAAQQQQQQQHQQQPMFHNMPPPPPQSNGNITTNVHAQPINNGNGNVNGSAPNGGWLPSFFVFGNNKPNAQNTQSTQDMDLAPSPPIRPGVAEEKADVLGMDDMDDDEVLAWKNDYGTQQPQQQPIVNPLIANPALLKTKGVMGKGKFSPSEKRQCGWILCNESEVTLKLCGRLECIGGAQEQHGIRVLCEKVYSFTLKAGEEVYILVEVEAPSVCGKYCAFYQLVLVDNNAKVGELLEINAEVQGVFNEKRERKIAQIIKMGFADRKKVVATLQQKKWNVQQSINELIKQ